jgi:pyruvate kinase
VLGIVDSGCATARSEGHAKTGDLVAIAAGIPFGIPGATNLLHIVRA